MCAVSTDCQSGTTDPTQSVQPGYVLEILSHKKKDVEMLFIKLCNYLNRWHVNVQFPSTLCKIVHEELRPHHKRTYLQNWIFTQP